MSNQPERDHPRRYRSPRGQGASLRDDLVGAALELLGSEQPVTLRGVARRAGVSAMAPYRQFDDLDEILVEVKRRCYAELAEHLRRAPTPDDPHQRLTHLALAYARYGLDNPGAYRIMFSSPAGDPDEVGVIGREPLELLHERVADALGTTVTDTRVATESVLLWSALHGITHLRLMRATPPRPPLDEEITACVERIIG